MAAPSFCENLKVLRNKHGVSQLELSLKADISQRHVSFLESGRSTPSKDMLFKLSKAFMLSLQETNRLFLSAGFAPPYAQNSLDDKENEELKSAVKKIITSHLPNPAIVYDHLYNVLDLNEAALKLFLEIYGVNNPADLPDFAMNSVEGLFHPSGYGKYVTNFEEVALFIYQRLLEEVNQTGSSEASKELLNKVHSFQSFKDLDKAKIIEPSSFPSLVITINKNGIEKSFYTVISSFGAPFDVTIQNLRIELFFGV